MDPDHIAARLEAHWAAQLVAAPGHTLGAHAADDSHTAFEWLPQTRALAGQRIDGRRAALRIAPLSLLVLGGDDAPQMDFALAGQTLDDGREWLEHAFGAKLELTGHNPPDHDVARGASFRAGPGAAFERLEKLYADAAQALATLGPPVRCWPHHFDIATLIRLEGERTIGVGMSPGDGTHADAYWYVTPWPRPKPASLPPLEGGGTWHDGDWFGAILKQGEVDDAFLRSAIAGARGMLE